MTSNSFKISRVNGTIIIEKNEQGLALNQTIDDDIWFSTSEEELTLEINMSSRNHHEWQTYMVFETLMKSIVGRYILNGDNKKENSKLPRDFINLDKNIITWHSDNGIDNVLKLSYDKNTITITISKSKNPAMNNPNTVRIRTNGSSYEYYYQEFLEFFRHLNELERRLNKNMESKQLENKEKIVQKKLSLFNKNKK